MNKNPGCYHQDLHFKKGVLHCHNMSTLWGDSDCWLGSITSGCSGNEPALLPRGQSRPDTRDRLKSSLTADWLMSNSNLNKDDMISFNPEWLIRYNEEIHNLIINVSNVVWDY